MIDRRSTVFFVLALLCFALYPVTDADNKYVPLVVGVVYVVLALATWADFRARRHIEPRPIPGRDVGADGPGGEWSSAAFLHDPEGSASR